MSYTEEQKKRLSDIYDIDGPAPRGRVGHLNVNEQRFVEDYMQDCNAKRAYIAHVINSNPMGTRAKTMLARPNVKKIITQKKEEFKKEFNVTPERTLKEYVAIAMANVRDVFTWEEDGQISMKPVEELTPEQTAAIAEIQFRHDYKGNKDYIAKVKFHNKNTALEALSRHLGLFEQDNKQKSTANADVVNKLLDIIGRENKDLAIALKQELIREMHQESDQYAEGNTIN